MTDPTSLVYRLKQQCFGRPATIPWPHRLLHDAADTITDLREENAKLRAATNQSRLAFAGCVSVQSAIDLLDALGEETT